MCGGGGGGRREEETKTDEIKDYLLANSYKSAKHSLLIILAMKFHFNHLICHYMNTCNP